MVQALHSLGLRVVLDVVYNHTFASGPYSHNSVLDKIVPGYYHRRQEDGEVCHSTCCNNTASEHRMFERLMIDDLMHWARDYKVSRCFRGGRQAQQQHSSSTAAAQQATSCHCVVQPQSVYSLLLHAVRCAYGRHNEAAQLHPMCLLNVARSPAAAGGMLNVMYRSS
jgi:hypothetical protein